MNDHEQVLRNAVSEGLCCWNAGFDHPWEGQAIIDAEHLAELVKLAAKAPVEDVNNFIRWAV